MAVTKRSNRCFLQSRIIIIIASLIIGWISNSLLLHTSTNVFPTVVFSPPAATSSMSVGGDFDFVARPNTSLPAINSSSSSSSSSTTHHSRHHMASYGTLRNNHDNPKSQKMTGTKQTMTTSADTNLPLWLYELHWLTTGEFIRDDHGKAFNAIGDKDRKDNIVEYVSCKRNSTRNLPNMWSQQQSDDNHDDEKVDPCMLKCPKPLVPFYNRVILPTDTASRERNCIPRIIHVSHKSRCLPQDLIEHLQQWKHQFPNYSIYFHDDEAVSRLFHEDWPEFPQLKTFMKCIRHEGAIKIDIWRLLILYRYGGIYTDIDNIPLDALTPELIENPGISAFVLSDYGNRPSQWFMSMEPGHVWAYMSVMEILQNVYNMENVALPKPVFETGPGAVHEAFIKFMWGDKSWKANDEMGGIYTGLDSKRVHKIGKNLTEQYIRNAPNYDDIVRFNETWNVTRRERIEILTGVTHWTKSMRDANNKGTIPRVSCKQFLKNITLEGLGLSTS